MKQLSHVEHLAAQMQGLIHAAGSQKRLAAACCANEGTIRRIVDGCPCRLKTVEKAAKAGGKQIGEMFLTLDVETDWYRDTALEYLPDNLLEWTVASGMGLAEIAEKVGLPFQTFRLYLEGSQYPMTNTLQKIADVLQVEVADLFLPPLGGDMDDGK